MIRLGVVGHGGRAAGVIQHALRTVDPELRVVAIVDPDEVGARSRLAECDRPDVVFYPSLDVMVRKAKLDGLMIGTRCNLHTPLAIRAARYDIPLYLEKPVAVSMQQATSLERAFRKSRCPVVVSFPLRVSPLCELARRYIVDDAVGNPVHIHATNYVPYGRCYWEDGYRNYPVTQGLFLQKATHDLDYMMYLMGSPIVRVSAMATFHKVFGGKKKPGLRCSTCKDSDTCRESPAYRHRHGVGNNNDHLCLFSVDCGSLETGTNEDCSSALVEFASGAHGVYTQVFYIRFDAAARGATVSGYNGTVTFDWYKNELRRIRHHEPFTALEKATGSASHFGGDAELAQDFIGLIRGTIRKSRTPIELGLQSAYTCLAARESALTGKFIKVRQVHA